jgi:hypothetical protein
MLGLSLQVTSPLELTLLVEKDYFKLLVSSSQQDNSAVAAAAAVANTTKEHAQGIELPSCRASCLCV